MRELKLVKINSKEELKNRMCNVTYTFVKYYCYLQCLHVAYMWKDWSIAMGSALLHTSVTSCVAIQSGS